MAADFLTPGSAGNDRKPPSLQTVRFLVADDDNTSRRLLTALLRLRGARVEHVANGQQAIDSVASRHYAMLFMDRHMPVIDGIDATIAIRNMGETMALLPIIGLTAYDDKIEQTKFINAGLNGCLSKPVRQPELWSMIGRWLIHPDHIGDEEFCIETQDNDCPLSLADDIDTADTFARNLLHSLVADLADKRIRLIDMLDENAYPAIADISHLIAGSSAT